MLIIKACPKKNCERFGTRLYDNFCCKCGTQLKPTKMCCEKESVVNDSGFCGNCGAAKIVEFQESKEGGDTCTKSS